MFGRLFRILALAAAGGGIAGSGLAGGLAARVVTSSPSIPTGIVRQPDWQGGYVGVALGYAGKGDDEVGISTSTAQSATRQFLENVGNLSLEGANLTLRAGYLWDFGRWVAGPELAVFAGNVRDDVARNYEDLVTSARVRHDYDISLRMRVGYKLRPRTAVFGMAGITHGKFDYDIGFDAMSVGGGSISLRNDASFTATGYVIGIGIEHWLRDDIGLTGELEYSDFGKTRITWTDAGGDRLSTEAKPDYVALKFGLNYRF